MDSIRAGFDYYLGNTEGKVLFTSLLFAGLNFGWFFRKPGCLLGALGLVLFAPLLAFLWWANQWPMTLCFALGFLIHGHKLLKRLG